MKERLTKQLKILVIKFSLKNKFKVKKTNRKIQIIMREITSKMISKCKGILMVKCSINNKIRIKMKRENLSQETNKWDKYKTKKNKKT